MSDRGQEDMIRELEKDEEGATFIGGARKKVPMSKSGTQPSKCASKSQQEEIAYKKAIEDAQSQDEAMEVDDLKQKFIEECRKKFGLPSQAVLSESGEVNVAASEYDKEKEYAVNSYINWRLSLIGLDDLEKRKLMKLKQEGEVNIYKQKPDSHFATDMSLEKDKDFQKKYTHSDFMWNFEQSEDMEENAAGFSFQKFPDNLPSSDICTIYQNMSPMEQWGKEPAGHKNKAEGHSLKDDMPGYSMDGEIFNTPQPCQNIDLENSSQNVTWTHASNSLESLQALVDRQEKDFQQAMHAYEREKTRMMGMQNHVVKEDVSEFYNSPALPSVITEVTEPNGSFFCSMGTENVVENVNFPQFRFTTQLLIDFEKIEKHLKKKLQLKGKLLQEDAKEHQGSLNKASGSEKCEENSLEKYAIHVPMKNENSSTKKEEQIVRPKMKDFNVTKYNKNKTANPGARVAQCNEITNPALDNSNGFFIQTSSAFGNSILPVLPRIDCVEEMQ